MTTIAYFLFDKNDHRTKPQDEIIKEAHDAEHWFADRVTGELIRPLERPDFSALYKFAQKGDTLVVSSIECLGGCSFELFETLKSLKAKGVGVVSVREKFDLSSPVGKTLLKTIASISDLQRAVIGSEKRKGKK